MRYAGTAGRKGPDIAEPVIVHLTADEAAASYQCTIIMIYSDKRSYFPSFHMSVVSFQSFPTFSQTTTYFPVTSCGVVPLVFRANVPISRAAEGPSGLTSTVVSFGSPTCYAMPFHIASMAARPCTIAEPGGNTVASVA